MTRDGDRTSRPETAAPQPGPSARARLHLMIGVLINWAGPLLVYILVRPALGSDAAALAVASAVPVVRVAFVWLRRRRMDWIGGFAVLGLAVSIALSLALGGQALPIKLVHPALSGTLGLALIGSVLAGRPLLLTLYRMIGGAAAQRTLAPGRRRTVSWATAALGAVLLLDAAVHVVLALHVRTSSYLLDSRLVTLILLAVVFVLRRGLRRRS